MVEVTTADVGERYWDWIKRFPLRPLRSETDLDRAIETIDALSDLESRSPDEHDYMLVLAGLIHAYEDAQWPNQTEAAASETPEAEEALAADSPAP